VCEVKGWGFSPFALNTWGGLGSSGKCVLFEVTHRAMADLHGWAKTHAMETIRPGVSVTLMRQIARQLSANGRVDDRRFTWEGTHKTIATNQPPTKPRDQTAHNRQGSAGGKKAALKKSTRRGHTPKVSTASGVHTVCGVSE